MKPKCTTPKAIRCNSTVKSFSKATLKSKANIGPSELYALIRAGKGVISEKDKTLLAFCHSLRREMEGFIPSVPMRNKHRQQMKAFISGWAREIDQYIKVLSRGTKPIYLCDEVTKILKQKGLEMTCTNIQLEWHLSLQGPEHMTPEEIADAIIEFDGTDWTSVKHLKKDTHYNAHLLEDTPKERARFLKIIEFIYDIPSAVKDKDLFTKIDHDLTVLGDFNYWKMRSPKSYYYAEIYMDYVSQLQTAPSIKLNFDLDKDKADADMPVPAFPQPVSLQPYEIACAKFNSGDLLTAEDQCLMIQHKRCPRCGAFIEQRTSIAYGEFLYCKSCRYIANGSYDHPQIKYCFLHGVRRDDKNSH